MEDGLGPAARGAAGPIDLLFVHPVNAVVDADGACEELLATGEGSEVEIALH